MTISYRLLRNVPGESTIGRGVYEVTLVDDICGITEVVQVSGTNFTVPDGVVQGFLPGALYPWRHVPNPAHGPELPLTPSFITLHAPECGRRAFEAALITLWGLPVEEVIP